MNTITITREKYRELQEATKKLKEVLEFTLPSARRRQFLDGAFGALKDSFGKRSSVFYVSQMRKAWRK